VSHAVEDAKEKAIELAAAAAAAGASEDAAAASAASTLEAAETDIVPAEPVAE